VNHNFKGFQDVMIMKYGGLTGKIIGAAMEVHKALENGFQEVIYQRAVSMEMNLQGISQGQKNKGPCSTKVVTLVSVGLISLWKKK